MENVKLFDKIVVLMRGKLVFYGAPQDALAEEITIDKGKVVQSNFHNYTLMRIPQMPKVEVHIVPSAEPPSGVGEPGVPPVAGALANALFAATGKPVTRLPIGERV